MRPKIFTTLDESDKKEVEKIYTVNHKLMQYLAESILNNHTLAEDAVSESFIKIIKHIKKIKSLFCYQQRAYIVNIVKSVSLDMLRKQKKLIIPASENEDMWETIPDSNTDILEGILVDEGCESIKEAIKALPETLKQVAYFSIVYGLSHDEIAELLNITRKTSKTRLYRAKHILRNILAGENYE